MLRLGLSIGIGLVLLFAVNYQSDSFFKVRAQEVDAGEQKEESSDDKTEEKEERVRIFSDKAIYKKEVKQARAIGKVRILQEDTTIYADEATYYEDTKHSFIEDGVKVVQIKKEKKRKTVITGDVMTAYHEEKRIIFEKNVRMDREQDKNYKTPTTYTDDKGKKRKRVEKAIKKERTIITSDRMEYFTKSENANLDGNVVVLQKEKKITGDKGVILGEEDGDTITIEGNAKVTQIRGDWLLENKIIKPKKDDEEQERLIKEKLTMDGDKIIYYKANDDLDVIGNVVIKQKVGGKERVATGKKAEYREKKKTATLTGDVKIKRENGDWLNADIAIFYTEKEDFEAIGTQTVQVESEFTIDEDKKKKEPINPPAPEYDLDQHQPGPELPSWLKGGVIPSTASPTPTPTPTPTPEPKATLPSYITTPIPGVSASASPTPSVTSTPASSATPSPEPSAVESTFIIDVN